MMAQIQENDSEIPSRKRLQEELSVVYDALCSSVSGVIIANPDGRVRYVNPAFLRMFDYTNEADVLGRNTGELFTSKELEHFFVGIVDSAGSAETDIFEITRNNGTTFPVEVTTSSVTDQKGDNIGRMAWFIDVSEREMAKHALRESEERYRRITEAVTDYIYTVRIEDGRPVETTHGHACVAVTGFTTEDFKANPQLWIQMVHEEDRQAVMEQAKQIIDRLEATPVEHRIFRKDGALRWVRNTPVLNCDVHGKLVSYDGLIQDITETKQAAEALQASETKYSTLAENSLTGIYIDQGGKIVFANNRFAEIYRYPKSEAVGIESWKLVHPEDRELTDAIRAKRLKGEDAPSEYEARGLTKNGETIWVKRRNRLIEYRGRPAILGNIVNISAQKRAEEELRKTNTELKAFLDVVSHDLKNPIMAIQGFSARLLKTYEEKLGEDGRRYLGHISKTAHRMEALVRDLLELSRIDRIVPRIGDVSSLEIVTNVVSSLEDRLEKKEITVVLGNDLPVIRCDGEQIYQVFENLLVNAVKFTGDTNAPRIQVGYEPKGPFHQFYVRDTGIGIDPAYHRKIFEMFCRLKDTDDEDGTGLGLAIVERIVNNHGGKVWVESEKGKGATFFFTLPKSRLTT